MARPRRAPSGATRARLLGCVLVVVLAGLLTGAAACADADRPGSAAGHGTVLRADGLQADGFQADDRQADERRDIGLQGGVQAHGLRDNGLQADGLQADGPDENGLQAGLRVHGLHAHPRSAGALTDDALRADTPPPPHLCPAVHSSGAPASGCPGAPEGTPAAPLPGSNSHPGPCPAPAGPPHAATAAAAADRGVCPPPPSAVGSPCLHELQVQRT